MGLITIKPETAKWSDDTGAEISVGLNFATADFLRAISEDALKHAAPTSKQYEQAVQTLKQLYDAELLACDHSYTEKVSVDDTVWLEPDGPHARINEDEERCLICGAFYNKEEQEWQQQ